LLHLLCAAGTLTVQGLELQSIVSVNNGRFEPASNDMTHLPPSLPQLLASCHGLAWLGQTLVGDPLDQKLFAASGWNLVDVEHGGKAGGAAAVAPGAAKQLALVHPPGQPGKAAAVVRRFEFSSQLMRNAVVVQTGVMLAPGGDGRPATPGIGSTANGAVAAAAAVGGSADTEDLLGGSLLAAAPPPGKSSQASSGFVVFVKGSPEVIKGLVMPSSVPPDFDKLLGEYTKEGLRVLALARGVVQPGTLPEGAVLTYTQQQLEAAVPLELLGLAVLANPLRPDSAGAIDALQKAQVGCGAASAATSAYHGLQQQQHPWPCMRLQVVTDVVVPSSAAAVRPCGRPP
jgi:magnesium-transporting ATPase (P-type)